MIAEKKSDAWIQVIDESINADISRHMHLYLQCGTDFFSAAIIDTDRNKFVALLDFRFAAYLDADEQCEKILSFIENNKPLLDNIYDKVILSFAGYKSTLVPEVFFDENDAVTIFAANHFIEEGEKICFDNLRMSGSKNIYAVPSKLFSFFSAYYSGFSCNHASTPLIEGILAQHKNIDETIVSINVQSLFFEMIVTKGKNLVFHNQFRYQSGEDFIYYVLFVLEQLHLNPEIQEVYLSGMIEKNSALFSITQKYIRHNHFVQRPSFCDYSYGFDNTASHFHFSLYNQFLCA